MKRAQRSRRFCKFVAVTLSVGALTFSGLVAAGPSSAHVRAVDVACGETITDDTTLHADLVDCPSNGLVIGADDVTLDLNGHTIDGDAVQLPCPESRTCDLGVDNTNGHDGVTIKG